VAKKSKAKAAAQGAVLPVMPPPIDWAGPLRERKVVKSTTKTSVYVLDDGTELKVKHVVLDVKRAIGQYNQHGQPLYFVTIANSITTDAPQKLLQKRPGSKRGIK
jgi:hypothetical protein